MTYFHTNSVRDIQWLANTLQNAANEERRVRFDVDSQGCLKVKVGEGIWTAPISGTPDPYRDLSEQPDDDTCHCGHPDCGAC